MSADFLDTNVFIYLFDDSDDRKRHVAENIVRNAVASGTGVISFQIVQEALNVLTRKLGASPYDARRFLDAVLAPLWSIGPSPSLYAAALEVQARYGFGFYDSLVVAAARAGGCERLLSEDLQNDQIVDGVRIVDPFGAA